ncbi:hypothetical protein PS870_05941 [Pseudomonas fluorescens]|uniref:Uncharacterized protein n=1 Tax=Pseudomonas fluorescens TaxID=294 RepID=A0A5E7QAQ6_PSEFL|nr:type VI secretion protein ImpA [Pseudomonas fluorescens]VVP58934.1 hypothetical protein PS870_05941 [Pseudomonas fluorescens]
MAVLHPLECYLLETFSSPEHFAATRDAIIEWIDAHEAAFARLQGNLDPRQRSKPQWQQGDVVWGKRFLPRIRPNRELYINAYIQRVNNDPLAFKAKTRYALDFNDRRFSEFRNGWMIEEERQRISLVRDRAAALEKRLENTSKGGWCEGDLTYNGQGRIYRLAELPARIPRYVLDPSVRIEKNQRPKHIGIYLPDEDFAAAQLLYPIRSVEGGETVQCGVTRNIWIDSDTGMRDFGWKESHWTETGWTLIRRVEGELIKVPEKGFFPEGRPNELYSWPEREAQFISRNASCNGLRTFR